MPKRDWRNGLAFGLIVGICLATLVYVFGSFAAGEVGHQPNDQHSKTYVSQNEDQRKNPDESQWWGVARRLVSSEDTLAQWIMAFLSLAAVVVSGSALYWVNETLKATRQMAVDTRRIGEAQVRAYLTIEECYAIPSKDGEEIFFNLRCSVRNCGQSPARRLQASIFAENKKQSAGYVLPDIAAGGECNFSGRFSIDKHKLVLLGDSAEIALLLVSIEIQFEDVFQLNIGKTIETADFVGQFKIEDGVETELNSVGRFMSDVRTGNVPK